MSEKELSSLPTHIAFMKLPVEVLWEMEQPAKQTQSHNWPVFPMTFEDQRYTIGLLWLNEKRPDDNREQTFSSAAHQLRRLSQSPDGTACAAYDQVLLQEYQDLSAIEIDPEPEIKGYYLPHHAVIKDGPNSTNLRVVFNASASQQGFKSLNDVLDPGPSLLPNITGLLY